MTILPSISPIEAIDELVTMAARSHDSQDALRWTQAALNTANLMRVLADTEETQLRMEETRTRMGKAVTT